MLPIAPAQNFASDNTATVHPAVMQALVDANVGHQIAYGDDIHTAQCAAHFRDLLGDQVESLLVWGGTGANVVGLASMLHASEAVLLLFKLSSVEVNAWTLWFSTSDGHYWPRLC